MPPSIPNKPLVHRLVELALSKIGKASQQPRTATAHDVTSFIAGLSTQRVTGLDSITLAKQKLVVAEQIRGYYQQNGVDASEELVAKGVSDFLDKWLTFRAPPQSKLEGKLVEAFLDRHRLAKKAAAGLGLTLVVAIVGLYALNSYESGKIAEVEASLEKPFLSAEQTTDRFDIILERATNLSVSLTYAEVPSALRLVTQALTELKRAPSLAAFIQKEVTSDNRDEILEEVVAMQAAVAQIKVAVDKATALVGQAESLAGAYAELRLVESDARYSAAAAKYAGLLAARNEAFGRVTGADSGTAENAVKAVAKLKTVLAEIPAIDILSAQLDAALLEFNRMPISRTDYAKISEAIYPANKAVQALERETAQSLIAKVTAMLDYAKSEFTLTLMERANAPLGIEKPSDSTGAAKWFLFVETVHPSGKPVLAQVKSSKTGEMTAVSSFGVSVPKPLFDKVQEEKKQKGAVTKLIIGGKPLGSLTINYLGLASNTPETLTEW